MVWMVIPGARFRIWHHELLIKFKKKLNEIDLNLKSKNFLQFLAIKGCNTYNVFLYIVHVHPSSYCLINVNFLFIQTMCILYLSKEFVTRLLVFADYRESIGNPKTDRGHISTNT